MYAEATLRGGHWHSTLPYSRTCSSSSRRDLATRSVVTPMVVPKTRNSQRGNSTRTPKLQRSSRIQDSHEPQQWGFDPSHERAPSNFVIEKHEEWAVEAVQSLQPHAMRHRLEFQARSAREHPASTRSSYLVLLGVVRDQVSMSVGWNAKDLTICRVP